MATFFTRQIAATGFLIISCLTVVYHLLILTGVIPYEMVWGGRLESHSQMLGFETVSISLNLVMLVLVATEAGFIKLKISRRIRKTALWAMTFLFLLNTLGNLASVNEMEKMIFTPVTLLLAVFSLRLAIGKKAVSEF